MDDGYHSIFHPNNVSHILQLEDHQRGTDHFQLPFLHFEYLLGALSIQPTGELETSIDIPRLMGHLIFVEFWN